MSEIQLSTFEHPISREGNVGYAPANTPVFYFHDARPADLHNIRYLKQSLGLLNEEKKINDIIEWMTSNGKHTVYMTAKQTETKRVNELLCKFILKYLNELCWKTLSTADNAVMNAAPNQNALLASELSTIDVHDALKQIIPAFQGVGQIMSTMLEYKYPSKLVGASLSSAIKQVNLEVEEKTGEILNKKVNKKKK